MLCFDAWIWFPCCSLIKKPIPQKTEILNESTNMDIMFDTHQNMLKYRHKYMNCNHKPKGAKLPYFQLQRQKESTSIICTVSSSPDFPFFPISFAKLRPLAQHSQEATVKQVAVQFYSWFWFLFQWLKQDKFWVWPIMDAVEGCKTVILLPFAKIKEENPRALPYILMEIET